MTSTPKLAIKKRSLISSTGLVATMTMLSRLLGFVRDVIIAQLFGAQAGIDAFFVAFKIPNFMRRLFAEGAFSQAFVPVLSEYQKKETELNLKSFIAKITGNLTVVLALVTVIGIFLSAFLVSLFAPGFEAEDPRFTLASEMLKITFPYLWLISLTALSGAILNSFGLFGIPAFTPVLLNISMIVAAVYGAGMVKEPVIALAWGVLVAGVVQLLFQLPYLYRAGLLVRPRIDWHDQGVKKVLTLMVPALFGVSVAQINLLLDTVFASFLPIGSVSWLYYSDRLAFFPLGVFGVAISTVILPHLSRQHVAKAKAHYSAGLDWGMRLILLIALPSTMGLVMFSKPLLLSLLGYGQFTQHDVLMTQRSLVTFSLGIPAFMLIKLLGSAFYATQNIKTPVKVGAWAMVLNSILCLLLISPLQHAGLALASSMAGVFNAGVLLRLLIVRNIYQPQQGWLTFFCQLGFANGLLAVLLLALNHYIAWENLSMRYRLMALGGTLILSMVVYGAGLFLMGIRAADFRGKVRSE